MNLRSTQSKPATERITDEDIEVWKPALEKETAFA